MSERKNPEAEPEDKRAYRNLPKVEFGPHELDEQSYRLNVFLEIISEADLLLLKRLIQDRKEKNLEKKAA